MNEMSTPWLCQVLFADQLPGVVTLDVVAMEPCPFDEAQIASGTPLAIRLRCHDNAATDLVNEWVRDGRLIIIREVRQHDRSWLHLSGSGGRALVMELTEH